MMVMIFSNYVIVLNFTLFIAQSMVKKKKTKATTTLFLYFSYSEYNDYNHTLPS